MGPPGAAGQALPVIQAIPDAARLAGRRRLVKCSASAR